MENMIELEDCPVCRGNGIISHEGGWNVQVECADCGSHTVYVEYENEEEKAEAEVEVEAEVEAPVEAEIEVEAPVEA